MKVTKRHLVRSVLGAAAALAVMGSAWAQGAPVKIGLLATLEGPMALGGAFVVERVLSLRGIGELTMLAVQQRDVAWLMAISMSAALIAAVFVVFADLAVAAVDPRLAAAVLGRKGRA